MLSADIVVARPSSLQSFNRYSYVMNNPLTLTDSSGFVPDGFIADPKLQKKIDEATAKVLGNTRVQGAEKVLGAAGVAVAAVVCAGAPEPLSKGAAVYLGTSAVDLGGAGLHQLVTGKETQTVASQAASGIAKDLGLSPAAQATARQFAVAAPAAMATGVGLGQLVSAASTEATLTSAAPPAATSTDGAMASTPPAASGTPAQTAAPATVGQILGDTHPDSMVHLTTATEAQLAKGVDAGSSWVRAGDVSHLTVPQYQDLVVGPAAAGHTPDVTAFAVSKPGAAAFQAMPEVPNLANVVEHVNPAPVIPSAYIELPPATQ